MTVVLIFETPSACVKCRLLAQTFCEAAGNGAMGRWHVYLGTVHGIISGRRDVMARGADLHIIAQKEHTTYSGESTGEGNCTPTARSFASLVRMSAGLTTCSFRHMAGAYGMSLPVGVHMRKAAAHDKMRAVRRLPVRRFAVRVLEVRGSETSKHILSGANDAGSMFKDLR